MEALFIHPTGFHKATEESANWVQWVPNPAFQVSNRGYSFVEKFYIRKTKATLSSHVTFSSSLFQPPGKFIPGITGLIWINNHIGQEVSLERGKETKSPCWWKREKRAISDLQFPMTLWINFPGVRNDCNKDQWSLPLGLLDPDPWLKNQVA